MGFSLIKSNDVVEFRVSIRVTNGVKTYKYSSYSEALECSYALINQGTTHFIDIHASSPCGQSSVSFSVAKYSKHNGFNVIRQVKAA